MFLSLYLEIRFFSCLQTIENNRKSIGNNRFSNFLHTFKCIIILCLLTKFGAISITTAHFMDDSILFEIYGKYIGFADFKVPISLKHQYCMTLKFHRKTSNRLHLMGDRFISWSYELDFWGGLAPHFFGIKIKDED